MIMKPEEAIMKIKQFGLYHAINDLPHSYRTVEAFEMAIEVLEKKIPKEPEYETLPSGDFYVYCPTCGEVVMCDLVDSPILNEYTIVIAEDVVRRFYGRRNDLLGLITALICM